MPGQSGNPNGRPKGAKNKPLAHEQRLKDILLEEAYREVTVHEAEGTIQVPMARAVIRSLAVNAAKGNHRSQRLFTELLTAREAADRQLHNEYLELVINYKAHWEKELERRQALGINGPEPIPHPDHLEVDMATGQVRVLGPMTRDQKRQYDQLLGVKNDLLMELNELIAKRKRSRSTTKITAFKKQIEDIIGLIKEIDVSPSFSTVVGESLP